MIPLTPKELIAELDVATILIEHARGFLRGQKPELAEEAILTARKRLELTLEDMNVEEWKLM